MSEQTHEIAQRVRDYIRTRKLKKADIAKRMKISATKLSKLLHPRHKLSVEYLPLLAQAIDRPTEWLVTGKERSLMLHKAWDPKLDRAGVLLSRVREHDRHASTGSAIYRTFPLRLMQPPLKNLVCNNLFHSFREYRANAVAQFFELSQAADQEHKQFSHQDNTHKRRTFMRKHDVRRLIKGRGEYSGRTVDMARTFFKTLRDVHVREHGFRIFFVDESVIPTELALNLRLYHGITLFGNTFSLRRNRNYEIETIEAGDLRLEADIASFSELERRIPVRDKSPSSIIEQIKIFEAELNQWESRSHLKKRARKRVGLE